MTRYFTLLLLLFASLSGMSQMHVVIKPADTIVCFRDSMAYIPVITNAGTGIDTLYRWQKNGQDISSTHDTLFIPRVTPNDTGFYRCIVSVGILTDTSNTVHLRMHPKMKIDTLYRYNALGCPVDCKGQFKVKVSGGTQYSGYPPYVYDWRAGHSQDTIVFGLCRGHYVLRVSDSLNCNFDTAYFVAALKSPQVDFDRSPGDTIYLTNPNLTVTYPDSLKKYISNWSWDFADSTKVNNLNPATHTFTRTGTFPVKLGITDVNGCDTSIVHDVVVKVVDLFIPNVFTPDSDTHKTFEIKIKGTPETTDWRESYLSNEFIVFDRWGKKVYQTANYKSGDWNGDHAPDGTYFYILKCHGQYGDDIFKGSVTILRGL